MKSGQLLAVIDTPDVDQQLSKAKATLSTARGASRSRPNRDLKLAETTLLALRSRSTATTPLRSSSSTNAGRPPKRRDPLWRPPRPTLPAAKPTSIDSRRCKISRAFMPHSTARSPPATSKSANCSPTATAPRQSLFHIANTNPVRVFVNVPQIYSPGVKVGLEAEICRARNARPKIHRQSHCARPARSTRTTRTLLTEVRCPKPESHASDRRRMSTCE